mmetsp:Transcript_11192/g.25079  ORF Transcript_11192/g.25079 Transcript_11192/m.25079 type:complete len:230 (+) Transcript_11192:2120-2809(+)
MSPASAATDSTAASASVTARSAPGMPSSACDWNSFLRGCLLMRFPFTSSCPRRALTTSSLAANAATASTLEVDIDLFSTSAAPSVTTFWALRMEMRFSWSALILFSTSLSSDSSLKAACDISSASFAFTSASTTLMDSRFMSSASGRKGMSMAFPFAVSSPSSASPSWGPSVPRSIASASTAMPLPSHIASLSSAAAHLSRRDVYSLVANVDASGAKCRAVSSAALTAC